MTNAPTALFSCRNISLDLGGREILRDISLQVRRGEVLGIIGPNGAGKTSLFEVLSGRIQPKTGKVFLEGRDVTGLPLYARARIGIGRTFQTPVVPEDLTVGETFKAAREAYKPYLTRFDAEYGCEVMALTVPWDAPAATLDALDRRKLLLACLLMRRPKILLMDEPAAGLINSEVDEIDQCLRLMSQDMNISIIIVEHRIELLDTIADRIMVLDAGEKISEGSLAEVLSDPKVRAAYFEDVNAGAVE